MKQSLILIALVISVAASLAVAAENSSVVTVERPHQKWEQRKFERAVQLKPTLYLPDGRGPFTLVIIVNSSAGANDVFLSELPKALNKAGIAAAALDTFSLRGITHTAFDQLQITAFTMALDDY